MIKIRKLLIAGFRGIRSALPLDFTNEHRSLVVFGQNASGKSTITDAIEWYIRGKVDHLWREDCKEASLRNVLLGPAESSEVAIEFSDASAGTKRLSPGLSVVERDRSTALRDLVEALCSEHLILRHGQIAEFVQARKSEKRKALLSIIGYDQQFCNAADDKAGLSPGLALRIGARQLIALTVFANFIGGAEGRPLVRKKCRDRWNILILHLGHDAGHDGILALATFIIAQSLLDVIVMLSRQDRIVRTNADAIVSMAGNAKSGRCRRRTDWRSSRTRRGTLEKRSDRRAILF